MSAEDDEIEKSSAPLIEHLVELRRRLIWCIAGFFIAFLGCFFFAKSLFNLLVVPDYIWFYFPLIFWGFGLLMHYIFGVREAAKHLADRQARIEQRARQLVKWPTDVTAGSTS